MTAPGDAPTDASEGPAPPTALHRWAAAAAAVAVGVALYAYYWRVFAHSWYAGPVLYDYGWFNDLVSGRTLNLASPTVIGDFPFYAVHVSPLLSVFAWVSRTFGLHGPQPLALPLSLAFAGAGAMTTLIVARFLRPLGWWAAAGLGLAAGLAYGLSGIMRGIADYPHIEILFVPLALLTLQLIFQRRRLAAWAALAVCLLTREDAGLHLATVLGAYLVLATLDERGLPQRLRQIAPYLGVALLYPALAILWQRTSWPDMSTFSAIYAGPQPFKHITPDLYAHRIGFLFGEAQWLPLTLAAMLCTLALHRRWTALTGLVACAPWVLLNLSAFSDAAGALRLYYGFPLLVAALAPLIVADAAQPPAQEDRLDVVAL
jgi:hypothetical protein